MKMSKEELIQYLQDNMSINMVGDAIDIAVQIDKGEITTTAEIDPHLECL